MLCLLSLTRGICTPLFAQTRIGQGRSGSASTYSQDTVGGVIVSTIEANPAWPGPRPTGIEQRLGYDSTQKPSDDQMLLDVCMQLEDEPLFQSLTIAEAGPKKVLMGQLGPNVKVLKPSAGNLSQATPLDRQWLVLAMLKRSTNKWSFTPMSNQDVEKYGSDSLLAKTTIGMFGGFRLFNHYRFIGGIQNNSLKSDVFVLRNLALIGPTPWRLKSPAKIQVDVGGTIYWHDVAPILSSIPVPNFQFAPLWGNGLTLGGKTGDRKVGYRNASRIGPLLMPYEDYLLNNVQPPPFYNELLFPIIDNKFAFGARVSNEKSAVTSSFHDKETGKTWPTHYIYEWVPREGIYKPHTKRPQISSPFAGFLPPLQ